MKKVSLSLALIIGIVLNVQAQLAYGVRAGYNHANFGGPDARNWGEMDVLPNWKPGYHLGGFISYMDFQPFIFEVGLYFSAKGAKYTGEYYDVTENGNFSIIKMTRVEDLKYLDIPLHVRYLINENFSVFAGPQLSFMISAIRKDTPEGGQMESANAKDDYKSMDFLLDFGLAYMLDNGIQFQLEYNHGLSNISDYGHGGVSYYTLNNRVFKLSVGFVLNRQK
ncbi:MAG: porin family protein [Cyclobacteriaceae bacterium]